MKGWVFSGTAEHSLSQSAKQLEIHTWKTNLKSMSLVSRGIFSLKGKLDLPGTSLTRSGHREQEELEWIGGQCAGPGLGTAQLEN